MSHTATCEHHGCLETDDLHALAQMLDAEELEGGGPSGGAARPRRTPTTRAASLFALPEIRWSALSMLAFVAAVTMRALGGPGVMTAALFTGCYLAGGWQPTRNGLRALRRRSLDVDALMVVAALAAAAIGQIVDGGLLIVIFATSAALEALATKRTRDSVRSLLDLTPDRASRLRSDGSEETIAVVDLEVGDLVVVRPGERIGADAVVIDGASDVDQASITGEPMPVPKSAGDEVYAGTFNGRGTLRLQVERSAADSVVARIVALVDVASATKARRQLFIERIEQRYSMAIVLATLLLFALPVAAGAPLQSTLLRAMTFMIVASPCAVVLATMPPLLSAMANAGRNGVLVKSAIAMEQAGQTTLVAFDKTGTLTTGRPVVAEVVVAPASGLNSDQLLALAAGAEIPSEHPLGRAIVTAAKERGLTVPAASRFQSIPGQGVTAIVDGRHVSVGSPLLFADGVGGLPSSPGPTTGTGETGSAMGSSGGGGRDRVGDLPPTRGLYEAGRTVVVVTVDARPAGVIGITDQVRVGASSAVDALQSVTGRNPVLITGDNPWAARLLAEQLGITDVRAGLLPHDKVRTVEELEAHGSRVAVVGDGVNDAPALVAAHLGIAMGRHGSDLALQTADVVIVHDDLPTVPAIITLSRQARRIVTQNLVFAATAICVLVTVDLVGHLPLPLGVAAHEGSTILVALNGLRLLSRRNWRVPFPKTAASETSLLS